MKNKKTSKTAETLFGIDHGSTNIGVALGRNGLVTPLKIISGKHDPTAISEITRLAIENKITKFVVGLPLTLNGKETYQSKKVRIFTKMLKLRTKRPAEFINEFKTTEETLRESIERGIPQKKRKNQDHLAAALILKRYYEENS